MLISLIHTQVYMVPGIWIIGRSLEFRSQTSDNMDRWKGRGGRSQGRKSEEKVRAEKKRRKKIKEDKARRKKMQVRERETKS